MTYVKKNRDFTLKKGKGYLLFSSLSIVHEIEISGSLKLFETFSGRKMLWISNNTRKNIKGLKIVKVFVFYLPELGCFRVFRL